MSGEHFAILGYTVGLASLWGYALHLLLAHRQLDRQQRRRGGK